MDSGMHLGQTHTRRARREMAAGMALRGSQEPVCGQQCLPSSAGARPDLGLVTPPLRAQCPQHW